MKSFFIVLALAALSSPALAEVPQEHSHEKQLRDLRAIVPSGTPSARTQLPLPDAVFGLLGKAVADQNAPDGDGTCLQQDLADTAISLANGDSAKIATALIYRALERNTQGVGVVSDLCNKQPVNQILVGLTQHQDPASQGADELNKQIELTLAQKLAEIGEDPLRALETATFPPGDVNDPTFKGETCDDENDANGCIFTLNLNRPAATEAEITAAVAGGAAGAGAGGAAGAAAGAAGDAGDAGAADAADAGAGAAGAADAGAGAAGAADAGAGAAGAADAGAGAAATGDDNDAAAGDDNAAAAAGDDDRSTAQAEVLRLMDECKKLVDEIGQRI